MSRAGARIAVALAAAVLAFGTIVEVVIHRAGPILKGRVIETLSTRFGSRVELRTLDVSVIRGLEVSGADLRIYPPDDVVAAGASEPLIAIPLFSFHAGIIGLFFKPMHVGLVRVTGMQIHIPPAEIRGQAGTKLNGKMQIAVDEIVCEKSRLVLENSDASKDPRTFELTRIDLRGAGSGEPWKFDAVLTNAVPRGDIRAAGSFGPWNAEDPGDSAVAGRYTFDHADLNTIKGISGTLSSAGEFHGRLNQIVVDGTSETPNFSLDIANHPMPLHTRFHAIVDGTTGDTYLRPVTATLRNSIFTTTGAVINIKGQGHRIELDVDVPGARVQDFLNLAVKTRPAVLTGRISMKTKLELPPGKESVPDRLRLRGTFGLQAVHFSNPQVQDKVDMVSLRARGEPKLARAGAADVNSQMNGTFRMAGGVLQFSDLRYTMPGARVNLTGIYSLDGRRFDFHGDVLTEAPLWRMVDSRLGSFLLRAVSPFFRGKNGGSKIPVSISGTQSAPKFGLDLMKR